MATPKDSPQNVAVAIMEQQAGATPTFDCLSLVGHTVGANKAGILEQVDWKPLITEDTNPDVVLENPYWRGAIAQYAGHSGLMYNPEKVPADKVPQTLRDLADPQWKGKVGIHNAGATWSRWAFVLGKEKVYADLRAILKNKAIQGRPAPIYSRYLLGEVWLVFITSSNLKEAQDAGMPAAWGPLDFSDLCDRVSVVLKGAAHPNAAKLVAIYIATPAGARFLFEETGAGSFYYPFPGNYEYDIREQSKRRGIVERFESRDPALIDFMGSDEQLQWAQEIELILRTEG